MKNEAIEGEKKGPGGRPPYYSTLEELQTKIDEYWVYIKGEQNEQKEWIRDPEYPTITGLALFLGFTTRQALLNYEGKPEFVDSVKKAKLQVEKGYEQALFGKNAAGPIFALKNFNWSDRQEIDHTSGGERIQGAPPVQVFNTAPPLAESETDVDTK